MKTPPIKRGIFHLFLFATTIASGQGTVYFSMTASGLSTRVYMPDTNYPFWTAYGNTSSQIPAGTQLYTGALVTGNGWNAQLWAAPGADQPESALQPSQPITTFRTGSAAGVVAAVVSTLNNVPAGAPVATVQVRVWPSPYTSWNQAWQDFVLFGLPNGAPPYLGKSLAFNVTNIGGQIYNAPGLSNLRSFSLANVTLDMPYAPLIYQQPSSVTCPVGGHASISVQVACPGMTVFNWLRNGTTIQTGTGFAVQYTNTLDFPSAGPSQAGIYTFVVTNRCCPLIPDAQKPFAISSNAVLIVGNPGALTVARDDLSRGVLNWDGVFFLQSATNVAGPFTDLPGPVVFGPYTNTDLTGPQFFRLRN